MTNQTPGLLGAKFVQMAYITNDFDKALAVFRERHGVERFLELRDFAMETRPGVRATVDLALAWAGNVQIEIIRPVSGADEVYREILDDTDGFQMKYHHEAQQLDSLEALESVKREALRQGFPVVIEGRNEGGVTYFYADCRATLGHHVEYIYYPEAAWAEIDAAIPRN